MSAEIAEQWELFLSTIELQWGRARMSAEMMLEAAENSIRDLLQWGRARMSAEIQVASRPGERDIRFNGAALG